MEQISKDLIQRIAELSKLYIEDNEMEKVSQDINTMLDFVDKMKELDELDIEETQLPCLQPEGINVLRKDVPENGDGRESTLAGAPQIKDGMFVVPSTLG